MTNEEKKNQIKKQIADLQKQYENYVSSEQAYKLLLNSIYGAFGNKYFHFFNVDIAEAITLQSQDILKYSAKFINDYFREVWHNDTELHEKIGLSQSPKKIEKDIVVYGDTDSVDANSVIRFLNNEGEEQSITIEKLWEHIHSQKKKHFKDFLLNEILIPNNLQVLNWVDGKIKYSRVRKFIRHKVTKKKWKIRTSSGKEIICTDDHSIIVFRNDEKISIKPSEILLSDKILTVEGLL